MRIKGGVKVSPSRRAFSLSFKAKFVWNIRTHGESRQRQTGADSGVFFFL